MTTSPRPVTVPEFRAAKGRPEKLAVVTAYDYATARLPTTPGSTPSWSATRSAWSSRATRTRCR